MAPPTVAVVIPTHGRPALLAEALASVAAQSVLPAEVVVVDDLGDNATRLAVDEAALMTGVPVRLRTEVHAHGVARSRNLGWNATSAPLVAFLDDDDRWLPSMLMAATARLEEAAADFAVAWATNVGASQRWDGAAMPDGLGPGDVVAVNPGFTGSNAVYRRSALERVGGFDETLTVSNDKDLLVRLLLDGASYAAVPERLVERRLEPGLARLGTGGGLRIEGLQRYLEKHRPLLSAPDRRLLEARILRLRRQAVSSRWGRMLHAARIAALLGPRGVVRLRADDRMTRVPRA
jgi:glycosyltransferase involved in cell wall biosynthesis